jgi:hypothetical protein
MEKKMMRILSKLVLLLVLTGVVFAEKVATLSPLKNPYEIQVDKDRLYITEGPVIFIFSAKDFKLINKFGKRGEGPREFKLNQGNDVVGLHILPDYLQVNSLGRISFFTRDGTFKRVMMNTGGDWFQPVGKNYLGMQRLYDKTNTRFRIFNLYDENCAKIKELYRERDGIQLRRNEFNPISWFPISYRTYKDKIFIDGREKKIYVFDQDGKKLYDIAVDYKLLPVTGKDKERYTRYYKVEDPYWRNYWPRLKSMVKWPSHFPLIQNYHVKDDKIFIMTFKEKDNKAEFLILDLKGKLLQKVFLPLKKIDALDYYPYTIDDGRFFQLIENQEMENWELHRVKF